MKGFDVTVKNGLFGDSWDKKNPKPSADLPTLDTSFEYHFRNLDASDANHCCLHNELQLIICIYAAVKLTKSERCTDVKILDTKNKQITADANTVSWSFKQKYMGCSNF